MTAPKTRLYSKGDLSEIVNIQPISCGWTNLTQNTPPHGYTAPTKHKLVAESEGKVVDFLTLEWGKFG
jgi:hypothetical protein